MTDIAVMDVPEVPEVPEVPAMSEVPEVVAVDLQEPVLPVVLPEPIPEQTWTYQPYDEAGRPMGGKQVIKYKNQDELVLKMQEQNTLLIRKLRSETRKNRLGIVEQEEISDTSQRYQAPLDFEARVLSPDERVRLSRDLLDPERWDEASDTFFESTVGVKPAALRSTLKAQQEAIITLQAKQETDAFLAANPGYYRCMENFEAITNWMVKNNLAPVKDNFQRAYDELGKAGVLAEAPVAVEVAPPVPVPVPVPAPVVAEPSPVSRIPSGLTRNQAADIGPVVKMGDDIVYEIIQRGVPNKVLRGLAAVNAMPSDEFKRRINHEPGFSKKVEKLEQAHAAVKNRNREQNYSNQ